MKPMATTLIPLDEVLTIHETRPILGESRIARGLFCYQYYGKDAEEGYRIKTLYLTGVKEHLNANGFYFVHAAGGTRQLVYEREGKLTNVAFTQIKDFIRDQLSVLFEDEHFTYNGIDVYATRFEKEEIFMRQAHNIFNPSILDHLNVLDKPLLQDTADTIHMCFDNVVYQITKDAVRPMAYGAPDMPCIWQDAIIGHSLEYDDNIGEHSKFAGFLALISDQDEERYLVAKTTIGYLLSGYKTKSQSKAVLLYDRVQAKSGAPEGGTGKGLFMQAISKCKRMQKIDGKQYMPDNRFKFQTVKANTDILFIDDPSKKLRFEDFHSIVTDGWNVEAKNQDAVHIPFEASPKLAIASNRVLEVQGNTNKRRQHILEFGPKLRDMQMQGIEQPIVELFGSDFFDGWSDQEWRYFYCFMIDCAKAYLKRGLLPLKERSTEQNYLTQKTSSSFIEWVESFDWSHEIDATIALTKYRLFSGNDHFKQNSLTTWIRMWASHKGYTFKTRPSNGRTLYWVSKQQTDLFQKS